MDSSVHCAATASQNVGEQSEQGAVDTALTPAWFADLYEQQLPGVYRYFLVRTGSTEDAADLAQQTFAQAFGAHHRFQQHGVPISAWIFRIARNLLIDRQRRQKQTIAWERVPEAAWPVADDDTEASVLRRESLRQLARLLEGLDPQKRDLLAMRFAGGLTVRDIASVLNRKEATVRSELRRVLLALKESYPHD